MGFILKRRLGGALETLDESGSACCVGRGRAAARRVDRRGRDGQRHRRHAPGARSLLGPSLGLLRGDLQAEAVAGHAVLAAAGGQIQTLDGGPLLYGKPGFENPHFVACGAQPFFEGFR